MTGLRTDPILIVGGYGVVGLQLAQLVRKRQPDVPLLLAGRSQTAADQAAADIGNAKGIVIDVNSDDPLANITTSIAAVVGAVNDPSNALMKAAIARAIPHVDITRWTERLLGAQKIAQALDPICSVTLSSSWMAGVSAIVARRACQDIGDIERIDTTILFRLKDKAGPNSVEYADRLSIPFRVWSGGKWRRVKPLTDPLRMTFPSGNVANTYRFDEPSQETLVALTGARSISSRIAYDDASTMGVMKFMVRSGLWHLISGPWFRKLRHAIIYNPGDGASHEIVIDVVGKDSSCRATILDPAGQTHLTAVGAYIQLCDAAGLEGRPRRKSGVHTPEQATEGDFALSVLKQEGVAITFAHSCA